MGSGSISNLFVPIRDAVESAGSLAGNFLLPGSSLLTNSLVSKGSQKQLHSPLGQIANIGTGLAGAGVGSGITGIPSASNVGAGWTNALNGAGNFVGAGDVGDKISNSFGSLFGTGTQAQSGANNGSILAPESVNSALAAPGISGSSGSLFGLGSALATGTGGGSSSYAPLLTSLAGGAISINANDQAQKDLLDAENKSMGQLNPYLASGQAANSRLSDLLGTSGNSDSSGYGSLTTPFTAADLQNDPGFKFQLQQGNQALDRKAAAGGNYFSGAALKAAQDYGQGLADTTLNNAFARDQAQKQQVYGNLSGQAGVGANAAGRASDIYEGSGNARAGAGISSANILNQTLSSLLSGSGAKRPINVGGQIYYI